MLRGKDVFGGGVISDNGSDASVDDLADSSWLEARNDDVGVEVLWNPVAGEVLGMCKGDDGKAEVDKSGETALEEGLAVFDTFIEPFVGVVQNDHGGQVVRSDRVGRLADRVELSPVTDRLVAEKVTDLDSEPFEVEFASDPPRSPLPAGSGIDLGDRSGVERRHRVRQTWSTRVGMAREPRQVIRRTRSTARTPRCCWSSSTVLMVSARRVRGDPLDVWRQVRPRRGPREVERVGVG